MGDMREIRKEVCEECKNSKGYTVKSCSIFQECAIDYNHKTCRYKKLKLEEKGD